MAKRSDVVGFAVDAEATVPLQAALHPGRMLQEDMPGSHDVAWSAKFIAGGIDDNGSA